MKNLFCPFCIVSWECEGPHIDHENLSSFWNFFWIAKDDHKQLVISEIEKYEKENLVNLENLKLSIKEILDERDF
jgi:Zn-finger protein